MKKNLDKDFETTRKIFYVINNKVSAKLYCWQRRGIRKYEMFTFAARIKMSEPAWVNVC